MAQDLVAKRRRIAGAGVSNATALLDAANGLAIGKLERAQSGNFLDADLETSELQHLTTTNIGLLFDFLTTELNTWLDAKVDGNNGLPSRRELLIQLRR